MRKIRPRKRRGSWLDLPILLLLLLLAAGGFAFFRFSRTAREEVPLQYRLLIPSVPSELLERAENELLSGASVRSGNGTAFLGTVAGCSTEPHRIPTVVRERIVWVEVPERYDLTVTVRANATDDGQSYRVRDIRVAAGSVVDLRIGGYYAGNCRILSVRAFGEEGDGT